VSLRRRALLATFPLALAALRLPPGTAATPAADPGALSHCAAIVAADERLACYDSLARPKPSAAATANSTPASAKASPHVATAPGTKPAAAAATAAPVAAAPAAAATTAGPATDPAKSFGLTKHPAPTEEGPDHIRAQVTRVDPGRFGDVRVSLDNGQAWTFTGPDALIRVGDAVTIRRGALGSFLLTTPAHRTYKAQRSQ
jgi:hypothetical protein